MIGFILFLLVWGAIVGGLGRLALPGPDPMTMGETILIGVGSSLVAGILFRLIFNSAAGIIGSVLGRHRRGRISCADPAAASA